jgi:hypothetical protein
MQIPSRFNGPPGSAHGGTACGVFASALDPRRATVRLLQPPPLQIELSTEGQPEGVAITGPTGDVALVRAIGDAPPSALPWFDEEDVIAARQHWLRNTVPTHPFPTCFGCGHARPADDGLELFAGDVPGTEYCAAFWTPDPSLRAAAGGVADWAVWSALDCPSGGATFRAIEPGTIVLLGELSVWVDEAPVVGTRYQVVSRFDHAEGRRQVSHAALVGADGANLAVARATWIALPARSQPR